MQCRTTPQHICYASITVQKKTWTVFMLWKIYFSGIFGFVFFNNSMFYFPNNIHCRCHARRALCSAAHTWIIEGAVSVAWPLPCVILFLQGADGEHAVLFPFAFPRLTALCVGHMHMSLWVEDTAAVIVICCFHLICFHEKSFFYWSLYVFIERNLASR